MTRHILGTRQRATLASFALSNVLLAFDFDGTLAPITTVPDRARMRRSTRLLLTRLSRSYPCMVISGRSLNDVLARLRGVPLWTVAGNHGVEPCAVDRVERGPIKRWVANLEAALAGCPGTVVEDKGLSIAVHYRNAGDKRGARRTIARALRRIEGARIFTGKQTVNLIPREAPHKGVALDRARRHLACDAAIYVGDDVTDEDAFMAASREQLLAIRVGAAQRTHATHHLRNQSEIDRLLRILIALRSTPTIRFHREGPRQP